MDVFADWLAQLENPQQQARAEEVLSWVAKRFPDLEPAIKWNQPMFTDHGTFIIGFSAAKKHMAVAPEKAGVDHFSAEIGQAGYEHTKMLVRLPWDSPVDFALLERMIEFNISEKADCSTFWRQ